VARARLGSPTTGGSRTWLTGPSVLEDARTKATVVLFNRQINRLDDLCRDLRKATAGQARRVAPGRAERIRIILDAVAAAQPTINADCRALVVKSPPAGIDLKAGK